MSRTIAALFRCVPFSRWLCEKKLRGRQRRTLDRADWFPRVCGKTKKLGGVTRRRSYVEKSLPIFLLFFKGLRPSVGEEASRQQFLPTWLVDDTFTVYCLECFVPKKRSGILVNSRSPRSCNMGSPSAHEMSAQLVPATLPNGARSRIARQNCPKQLVCCPCVGSLPHMSQTRKNDISQ